MRLFRNISINRKIIVIQFVTTLVVVLACIIFYTWFDLKTFKANKENQLQSITTILNANLEAPILFDDQEAANDILANVDFDPTIKAAYLILNNEVFASYGKCDQYNKQQFVNGVNYLNDHLIIQQQIKVDEGFNGQLIVCSSMESTSEHFWKRMIYSFVIFLIAIALGGLLGILLRRYLSDPILNLKDVMQTVIKTNDFGLRSHTQGRDEIGQIAEVFNKLLQKIEVHDRLLSKANHDLEQRVTDRTKELKEKNEKLLKANELAENSRAEKEQFLASMSHEIRTPLNAILGFTELMNETELSHEQKEFLKSIDFAGKNLLVIINDILDLSKIEAGKLVMEKKALDLRSSLTSLVEMFKQKAEQSNNKLVLVIPDDVPQFIHVDEKRFNQIFINLIGNATKFTKNGTIEIGVHLMEIGVNVCHLQFYVKDTGIGIAEEDLDSIFDRFIQGTADHNYKFEGTGLGLSIVKDLVELQNGKIQVESKLGVGSTFSFQIWYDIPNGTREVVEVSKESIDFDLSVLNGKRILLVEDIKLNQQLVEKILKRWNVNLDIASNGEEAIEKFNTSEYDLILMDIQMPIMDGYEATAIIREKNATIPIIALTAHATNYEIDRCKQIGMNNYITKPFSIDQLKLALMNNFIGESKVAEPTDLFENATLYDLSRLKENADGDDGFLRDMIETLIAEMPEKLAELKEAIAGGQEHDIRSQCHALKGICLTFGMNRIVNEINRLSSDAKENNFDPESCGIAFGYIRGLILEAIDRIKTNELE